MSIDLDVKTASEHVCVTPTTGSSAQPSTGIAARLVVSVLFLAVFQSSALAHNREPDWLDEGGLDRGVWVAIKHPRVVRTLGAFNVDVVVNNVNGDADVRVREVRYNLPTGRQPEIRQFDRLLASKRSSFQEYGTVREAIEHVARMEGRLEVNELFERRAVLLLEMTSDRFVDRYAVEPALVPPPGSTFRMSIEIDLIAEGVTRTSERTVEIPIQPPLPKGTAPSQQVRYDVSNGSLQFIPGPPIAAGGAETWFAGDQHLHTTYSVDAFFLNSNQNNVADYAAVAQLTGLDWIIVTDHANIHVELFGMEWYTPEQFRAGADQAEAYRDRFGFLVLNGQEMGLGQHGAFAVPSHYLAFPNTVDSMGYLENPGSGLFFGHPNCEPEQVVIDRVNAAGGLGFVAHPFSSTVLFYDDWDFDNGATGWAGLEIWSDKNGLFKESDLASALKWLELLAEIEPAVDGQLRDRKGFPTKFPVGLGNSDAHEAGLIGKTFTYAKMPTVTRTDVMDAFIQGRCVASNGPLAFSEINGAGIGDVALVAAGPNTVSVTVQSTPEFGPVGDFEVVVSVNGEIRASMPPTGSPGFATTFLIENVKLTTSDQFVFVWAASPTGLAINNPIWLEFAAAGDLNADGHVDHWDLLRVLGAWGPNPGHAADLNFDGMVAAADLLMLLGVWGPCEVRRR